MFFFIIITRLEFGFEIQQIRTIGEVNFLMEKEKSIDIKEKTSFD